MGELRCAGRAVDDQLRPTGPPCGRRYVTSDPEVARAGGWAIAPDGTATCPTCRRPPREVVELARSVRRREDT